ncbi:MAG: nucleotidyltransferase domain-containing protein [Acidobacteriales bacterium]|nr:nucleotidyltransferase domain-containing protein [Terriglobales bacterium]
MVPEARIEEFVRRLRQAAGANLTSVILFGSAAGGDFHPDFSNVNLLCVLREASFAALQAVSTSVEWWAEQKHREPLFLTNEELQRFANIFVIEFLDMRQKHRVLMGEDLLTGLRISLERHRAQVEYELREKFILLRQQMVLAAGNKKRLWELLLRSLPAFLTLFRHSLMIMGATETGSKRDSVAALASRLQFDASPFLQLLDIREGKANKKQFEVTDLCGRYLIAVQHAAIRADTMLDSTNRRD